MVFGMVYLAFGIVYLVFGMVYLIFGMVYLVFWDGVFGVWGGVFGLQPNTCGPGETYNVQDGLTGFQCMCENPPCGPGGHPEQGGG